MSDGRSGEPAKGEKHSWKKKARTSTVATGGKYWATGAGAKPIVSGNKVRLFVALTVLFATTASLVLYLLNQNSSTPLISIVAIDYEHPWAPNAWAKEDQQRLQALSESSQFQVAAKQEKKDGAWQDLLQLELEKIKPGGPGGSLLPYFFGYRTIIVHLSAHGVLNGRSQPCLLFADADPLNDASWVPLTEVLKTIAEHAVVVDNQARVLVILDTGKQPPDFRCGLLTSTFIDAAREEIRALPYSNFAVLLSNSEDQCAWTAPEVEGTVFGFMVAAGLQGTADDLSGNGNSRVTVQELAGFVAKAVDGYVRENRGRVQQPKLVWSGENQEIDFELCFKSNYKTIAASNYRTNTRIKRMSEAWNAFDQWNDETPTYINWPRGNALARLARAEQLLWAGSAYQDQFDQEIARAEKNFLGTTPSPWPDAICGGSIAFLNRIHGRDPLVQFGSIVGSPTKPDSKPAGAEASALGTPGTAEGDAQASTPESNATSAAAADASTLAETPNSVPSAAVTPTTPTPAKTIIQWLSHDEQIAGGTPAGERPALPERSAAVALVYAWLSENSQFVNTTVLSRVLDWIGPTPDPQSVSREEAILRTIHEHLQLTRDWNVPAADRLGQLWSQYLQVATECELAIATKDPRATSCLRKNTDKLSIDLQMVRDRIHGCQTARDASDCAIDLEALQKSARTADELRQRLERAWQLRDELAMELPTLAQWIASPISRLQTSLSASAAWDLSQQLVEELNTTHSQLVAGAVPAANELDALDEKLNKLISAYNSSLSDLMDTSAKGQRRPLSNLILSLGVRPNIYLGFDLKKRGELHQGINDRYQDFNESDKNTVSREKIASYSNNPFTEGVDIGVIWQPKDLPVELSAAFTPVLFTESALEGNLTSTQATAKSGRDQLAAVGEELRRKGRELPGLLATRSQDAIKAMDDLSEAKIEDAEKDLLNAEYHSHLLTQLLPAASLSVQPMPSELAHSVCNEQYALWQAQRALSDFWYTPLVREPFMLASSRDWQTIAARWPARGPLQISEQRHRTAEQLAADWRETLKNLQVSEPPENLWQAGLQLANFPTGRAWLRIALDGNDAQKHPLDGDRYQFELGTGELASDDANRFKQAATDLPEGSHELIAWFRGHSAVAPLPVYRQQPPITLAWQSEDLGDTTIRVNADPKPARIVFVLDCSGSMGNKRMQIAKDTLLDALRDLSRLPEGRTEIAVVLFGHTAEYTKAGNDDFSKWSGKRNRPYNDVEIVQKLSSPTTAMIGVLQDTLANLECWGRTPLYEAIRQSAELLLTRNDGFNGDLRVVVITDGDDNVFPYESGLAGNATAKGTFLVPNNYIHTEQSAIRFAAGKVSLDFIAFNFQAGAGGGASKLETMAQQTGGKVYQAGDLNLAKQLSYSIARDTYSTKDLKTGRTIASGVRLSDEIHIKPSQIPGQFEVQIDNTSARKTVSLVGGETIELQYRRQIGLSFLPHDEGDTYPEPGEFSYANQPYQAIMLHGKPDSIPQIHMCLQSADPGLQSMRPNRLLLEVRRVRSGKSGGERIAWTPDALWENHHRSPVLRAVIKNLPELQTDWLETRLWVAQPDSSSASQRLPVARLKEQPVAVVDGVMAIAETRTESGGLRLTVTETRQANSPLIHWQVLPIPDRFAEHQIYDKKVVHEYFFADPQVLNRIELVSSPLPVDGDAEWQVTQWLRVPAWK